jgi:hypothetical protein
MTGFLDRLSASHGVCHHDRVDGVCHGGTFPPPETVGPVIIHLRV